MDKLFNGLLMLVTLLPVGIFDVQAAEYALTVAGVTVTDANKADVLGNGVFCYNSSTNTLTIDGYCNYTSDYVLINNISGLTIDAKWDSTLVGSRGCVDLRADTTITGGKLTIKNINSAWTALSVSSVKLTINDAELYVDGAGRAISGDSNSNSKLEIIDSYVNSKTASTSSQEGAVMGFHGGITLDGCKIATPEDGYKSLGAIVVPGGSRPKTVVIERTYGSKEMHIGDYLQMGTYYGSPILWRCVDIDDNGPLMLADKIICLKAFDAKTSQASGVHSHDPSGERALYGANLWSASNIRSWLNSTEAAGKVTWRCQNPPAPDFVGGGMNAYDQEAGFLTHFTDDELSLIKKVTQKTVVANTESYTGGEVPYAPDLGGDVPAATTGGASMSGIYGNYDTAYYALVTDRVFLLDVAQLYTVYAHGYALGYDYFIGTLSEDAAENCEYTSEDIAADAAWAYWLRTPVTDSGASVYAMYPEYYITSEQRDGRAFDSEYGIRPAFYLGQSPTIGIGMGKGTEASPYVAFTLPDPDPVPPPRPVVTPKITFHTPITTITEGGNITVTATVSDIDTNDYKIKWSTDNGRILDVNAYRNASANVTALEAGTADIIAKVTVQSKVVAVERLTLTVEPAPVLPPEPVTPPADFSSVSIGYGDFYLQTGSGHGKSLTIVTDTGDTYFGNNAIEVKTYKIEATGGYVESSEIVTANVAWRASGNEYIWIQGNKVGVGAVELRMKNSNGEWCTCRRKVTVEEALPSVKSFSISIPTDQKYYPGTIVRINLSYQPSNAAWKSLVFTSRDPEIAVVDCNGNIKCLRPGQAMIKAELRNYAENSRYQYQYLTIQVHSRDEYKDVYAYDFINNRSSFGYPSDYQFPQSLYEAANVSEATAYTLSWAKDWGGSCSGMCVSSILFYLGKLNPALYSNREDGATATVPKMLKAPNTMSEADYNLRTMIELFQVAQFSFYDKTYIFSYSGADTYQEEKIRMMANYIQQGLPVALTLNTSKYAGIAWESGHVVLLYDYEYDEYGQRVFKIYDPSGFVDRLYFYKKDGDWKMWFHYLSNEYTWYPHAYYTYGSIMKAYNYLLRRNVVKQGAQYAAYFQPAEEGNLKLFSSVEETQEKFLIMLPGGEYTITSADGQQVRLTNEGMVGDIAGFTVDAGDYLSDTGLYEIRLPLGEYDITGTGEDTRHYVICDNENVVETDAPASATVHITPDVHHISVSGAGEFDYTIRFVEFDNVYDVMELSGTAQDHLEAQLDGWETKVTGAETLSANVTVCHDTVSREVSRLSGDDVTVRISDDTALGLLMDDELICEEVPLADREELSMPTYDLPSGEYNGAQTLKLTGFDNNTVIHYTTDGSAPDEYSPVYIMPITVNKTMTVRAIACQYGYRNSPELQLDYLFPTIAAPTADTLGGRYLDTVYVALRGTGTVLYTTDGSDPALFGETYVSKIAIGSDSVLRAVCMDENGAVSPQLCETYSFDRLYPVDSTILLTNAEGEGVETVADATAITFALNNYADAYYDGRLYLAFYTADGKCLGITAAQTELTQNAGSVLLPLSPPDGTAEIKVFVWDASMTPIAEMESM